MLRLGIKHGTLEFAVWMNWSLFNSEREKYIDMQASGTRYNPHLCDKECKQKSSTVQRDTYPLCLVENTISEGRTDENATRNWNVQFWIGHFKLVCVCVLCIVQANELVFLAPETIFCHKFHHRNSIPFHKIICKTVSFFHWQEALVIW